MTRDKIGAPPKVPTRERVLDAAERLLGESSAGFSMRQLADATGVSFATPFNLFGSKAAIMLALSARRIAAMHRRFAAAKAPDTTIDRVLLAVAVAVAEMLAAPGVNRAVMGAIGAPSEARGDVSARSRALWVEALGSGEGLATMTRASAMGVLPDQLAVAFRGVLSFWTAGEIEDAALERRARVAAAVTLLGFVDRDGRAALLALLG